MGKVVVAGRKRKRETRLEKKMKKENKRKKQARAEIESVEKMKEQLEKREKQACNETESVEKRRVHLEKEEEEQMNKRVREYKLKIEHVEKMEEQLKKRKKEACAEYLRKSERRLKKKINKDNKRKKQLEDMKKKLVETKKQLEEQIRERVHLDIHKYKVKYWERVRRSDGFHIEGLGLDPYFGGMRAFKCEKPNDCPLLVRLYAKIGIHRYNMLQGTNLQLHSIKKYNTRAARLIMPASYYITLYAENPATGSIVPFQISSHEIRKHVLDVNFLVARPEPEDTGTYGKNFLDPTATPLFYNIAVPKWPSENDKKQFYLVRESELKENDWIRLYLELGFVTTNRRIPDPKLSDLKIVEVMVETKENVEQPNERLRGFKDAIVYIKYDQYLGEGRVCKRRAIIRRDVDLRTERMSLMGDYFLETSETDDSEKSSEQHEASEICVSNIVT